MERGRKLRFLNEASALRDEELGVFLRKEGLHEVDLQNMREAALNGLKAPVVRRGLSPQEQELKALKMELRRKEKALAEAAALLILQKSSKPSWRKRATTRTRILETTDAVH